MKIIIGKLTMTASELAEYLRDKLADEGRIPFSTKNVYFEICGERLPDDNIITLGYYGKEVGEG